MWGTSYPIIPTHALESIGHDRLAVSFHPLKKVGAVRCGCCCTPGPIIPSHWVAETFWLGKWVGLQLPSPTHSPIIPVTLESFRSHHSQPAAGLQMEFVVQYTLEYISHHPRCLNGLGGGVWERYLVLQVPSSPATACTQPGQHLSSCPAQGWGEMGVVVKPFSPHW